MRRRRTPLRSFFNMTKLTIVNSSIGKLESEVVSIVALIFFNLIDK